MHAFEFLRTSTKGGAKPIYAVSGDDAYLRDETIRAIARQALGSEADDLAGATPDGAGLEGVRGDGGHDAGENLRGVEGGSGLLHAVR